MFSLFSLFQVKVLNCLLHLFDCLFFLAFFTFFKRFFHLLHSLHGLFLYFFHFLFVFSSISLRYFLTWPFVKIWFKSFSSASSTLGCSGVVGVESPDCGGVMLVFVLIGVFLYCHLPVASSSGCN